MLKDKRIHIIPFLNILILKFSNIMNSFMQFSESNVFVLSDTCDTCNLTHNLRQTCSVAFLKAALYLLFTLQSYW